MRKLLTALATLLITTSVMAAVDRHIFLDTDGDSVLNTCPNPAHNATGTAGNTSNMTYCASGADIGKVIGTRTGYTASCAGGVTPSNVVNGSSVDIDGDGTTEVVYGHPQACVWNMTLSDSCEVHAGTYRAAGTWAGMDVTGSSASNACSRSDCWFATITAWGYGATLSSSLTGYGTSSAPGYVRGAVMGSSTDTWDCDNDKTPYDAETETGCTAYPAIFSGDRNNNGTSETTTCTLTNANCTASATPFPCCTGSGTGTCSSSGSTGSCSGDTFYALSIGCGDPGSSGSSTFCETTSGVSDHPRVDTDANGTFDTQIGTGTNKKSDWLILKDIEMTGYNGGTTTCAASSGDRDKLGSIQWSGDGSGDGYKLDHVYWHNDTYSNLCVVEHYVAVIGDNENAGCTVDEEIKNSFFDYKNRFLINDDSDWDANGTESGCAKVVHDNRIRIAGPSAASNSAVQALARFKSTDTLEGNGRAKIHRFYNNEIIWEKTAQEAASPSVTPVLFYLECFGNCHSSITNSPGSAMGTIMFYGNIVRFRNGATATPAWKAISQSGCEQPGWHWFSMNNTFDIGSSSSNTPTAGSINRICNNIDAGLEVVEKNNAFFGARNVNSGNPGNGDTELVADYLGQTAVLVRQNNIVHSSTENTYSATTQCTTTYASTCEANTVPAAAFRTRASWFGSSATWGAAVHSGLANYVPDSAGPLYQKSTNNACDLDGDGAAGMDYDGDGDNDLTWTDIAGNTVSCTSLNSLINFGAIQSNVTAPVTAAPSIKGTGSLGSGMVQH